MFCFFLYLQEWKNEFLTWNSSDYGDVNRVHFAPDEIWVPDIALFNKWELLFASQWCKTFRMQMTFNPFTPKSAKFKTKKKVSNFTVLDYQKQTVPLESTAQ